MQASRFLSAVAIVLLSWIHPAAAQDRHAIVVGINVYAKPAQVVPGVVQAAPLKKAVPDAERAAKDLRSLGFNVTTLFDAAATRSAILTAWQQTLDTLKPGGVVLLYFAGHGLELGGRNFLLPHDVTYHISDPGIAANSAVGLHDLMRALGERQRVTPSIGVMIIDACRELPPEMVTANLSVTLAPVVPPRDVFVMYSTGIGQFASDGDDSDPHSPFATELFSLWTQDLALSGMAEQLRERVIRRAGELKVDQTPAYYDQLQVSRSLLGAPRQPQVLKLSVFDKKRSRVRSIAARDTIVDCSLCPEMVVIGGGASRMGAIAGSSAREHEQPQVEIRIAQPFALGKHEVTNQQWRACVDEGPCRDLDGVKNDRLALHPVAGVTWDDAKVYVAWLSRVTKRAYRLATEAEWEHAARSEPDHVYPHGASAAELCKYANGADRSLGPVLYTGSCDDGFGRKTSPAGSFLPNKRGLFDMSGNVWEWVEDCWHASHQGAPADGRARTAENGGVCSLRVARGGSWRSDPSSLTASARTAFPQGHSRRTIGLRVARDVMPDD